MALPKGWLREVLFTVLTGGIGKSIGTLVDSVRDPGSVPFLGELFTGEDIDNLNTRLTSTIGATIGSPLGLLPFLSTMYQAGMGQLIEQRAMSTYLPARITPRDLFTLAFRGIIGSEELDKWYGDLAEQGWHGDRIELLREAFRPILGVAEIKELYLRGELGKGDEATQEAITRIERLGYTRSEAEGVTKLFYYIPSVPDLVRMGVREAFTPEIVERYELHADFPEEFAEWAAKQGLTRTMALAYWASHWELPSVSNAFEMLHRGVIDEGDLDILLRTQDVMPYWRDKLKAIAYQPLTRVDVRRMYKLGVLDEDEVKRAYLDLGYNERNADRMTEFTIKYYSSTEPTEMDEARDLTRALIVAFYNAKIIERPKAVSSLVDLDYSPENAELIIALEDAKESESLLKEELDFISKSYIQGTMTRGTLIDRLGVLNLSGERQDYYLDKWERQRVNKAQRPTVSDLKNWFKAKLINAEEFVEEMRLEGYDDYYILKYIQELQ